MKVKVLGAVALIDEGKYKLDFVFVCIIRNIQYIFIEGTNKHFYFLGETDWKIIVIDINDPLADQINGKYLFPIYIFFFTSE